MHPPRCNVPVPIGPRILRPKLIGDHVGRVSACFEPVLVGWWLCPRGRHYLGGVRRSWPVCVCRLLAGAELLIYPLWGSLARCGLDMWRWRPRGLQPVVRGLSLYVEVFSRSVHRKWGGFVWEGAPIGAQHDSTSGGRLGSLVPFGGRRWQCPEFEGREATLG